MKPAKHPINEKKSRQQRRHQLAVISQQQREALQTHIAPWRHPLAVTDKVLDTCGFLMNHPITTGLAGIALARLGALPLFKWLHRAKQVKTLYQQLFSSKN